MEVNLGGGFWARAKGADGVLGIGALIVALGFRVWAVMMTISPWFSSLFRGVHSVYKVVDSGSGTGFGLGAWCCGFRRL